MWKKSGVNCPAENFTRASSLRIDVQGGSYLGLVVWRTTVQEKLSWAEFNGSYLSRGGQLSMWNCYWTVYNIQLIWNKLNIFAIKLRQRYPKFDMMSVIFSNRNSFQDKILLYKNSEKAEKTVTYFSFLTQFSLYH